MKKSQTNAKCFKILRFIHTFCVIFARLAIKSAKNACSTTNILHNLHKNWLSQFIFQSSSNFSLAFPFTSLPYPYYLMRYSYTIPMLSERLSSAYATPMLQLVTHDVAILKPHSRVCLEAAYSIARSSLGAGWSMKLALIRALKDTQWNTKGSPKEDEDSLDLLLYFSFPSHLPYPYRNHIEAAKHGEPDYSCDVVLSFGVAHSYVA